jgi:ribonucleoside-triphosphate reductase
MITIPVIKRDGEIVEFDAKKIATAISKANDSLTNKTNKVTKKEIENIVDEIEKECEKLTDKNRTVEAIQDLVEEKLLDHDKRKLARSYIAYREERTRVRNRSNKFFKDVFDKAFAKNIMNQNANVDEASFGGRKGEAANVMLKRLALDEVMSELHRKNHEENRIYIHDLDSYLLGEHNCLSIPFDKLLANGFNTRQTDVRPASSVNTAFQLVAVIFQLQSLQQFGKPKSICRIKTL